MSTLLDKFKLKKTPAKIAKIRIRMSGKQIGESSESSENKLNVNIFEERMKGRFTKPSIQITEFKKDDKIINKNPYIIFLQPTSPLRTNKHINKAFTQLAKSKLINCVSFCKVKNTVLNIKSTPLIPFYQTHYICKLQI